MSDLLTLENLREEALLTRLAAEQIGNFALAVAAQDIHDEAGDLIINLVKNREP